MDQVCTIGLNIAKNVFQVRGVDQTAAVALANKIARIAWAMMVRNEPYRAAQPTPA